MFSFCVRVCVCVFLSDGMMRLIMMNCDDDDASWNMVKVIRQWRCLFSFYKKQWMNRCACVIRRVDVRSDGIGKSCGFVAVVYLGCCPLKEGEREREVLVEPSSSWINLRKIYLRRYLVGIVRLIDEIDSVRMPARSLKSLCRLIDSLYKLTVHPSRRASAVVHVGIVWWKSWCEKEKGVVTS